MLRTSVEQLIQHKNLDALVCQQAVQEAITPEADPLQVAAFLVLLRAKQETAQELAAIVDVLRQKMITVDTPHRTMDIVGTGGDGAGTINISTGSAILAAACGVKVIKHGNRAVSSLSGAADVLEALGVNINFSSQQISACVDQVGISFCLFVNFHPVAFELRKLSKQLKIPTALNFIGPLLNPARVAHYLMGVFDPALVPVAAEVIKKTGTQHSMVVHGQGLDEISCIGPASVVEVRSEQTKSYILDPAQFGFDYCRKSDLQGGDALTNAQILLDAFKGEPSPVADTIILNTAVALYLYDRYATIAEAVAHAKDTLYSGQALHVLKKWREFSYDQ